MNRLKFLTHGSWISSVYFCCHQCVRVCYGVYGVVATTPPDFNVQKDAIPKDLIGMSDWKGITPTFLFFSDGIRTLNPILGRGLDS